MRRLDRDSLPHLLNCLLRTAQCRWHTGWARLAAYWWGVQMGGHSRFMGGARFRRHPGSRIVIGAGCEFRCSPTANLMGVNRPCIISTLKESAEIEIGACCGFSGTVIGCASKIVLGQQVRCGANTLITDTDWHSDDPRTGLDAPVTIHDHVWLGVNVMVLKGVTIGENTLIGAGSIVTRSLPAGVIAAGVPARVLRRSTACHQSIASPEERGVDV